MFKPHTSSFITVFVFCSCDDNKKPIFQNKETFRNDVMFKVIKKYRLIQEYFCLHIRGFV